MEIRKQCKNKLRIYIKEIERLFKEIMAEIFLTLIYKSTNPRNSIITK